MHIIDILISKIVVKRGRRKVNPEKVAQIAESISTIGLLNPIAINNKYELIAGHHRLEAYRKLGKKSIPAIITQKGLVEDLAEIDENLIRQELSVLERAECLQRRKKIYENLFPDTKKGGDRKSKNASKRNNFVSFSENTAQRIGNSRRTIEHEIQIASNISPDIKKMIRNTELANNKVELLKLARLDHKLQHCVVKELMHKDTSVDEIVKDLQIQQRIQEREKDRKKLLRESDSVALSGDITLYHGDCRDIFPDIIKSLKKQKQDFIVVTDPPYNIKFRGYDTYTDTMPDEDYINMMRMFNGLPSAIVHYPEQMMSLICPALGIPNEVLCWCYNTNIGKAFRLINIYNAQPNFNLVRQPYKNPNDKRVNRRMMQGSTGAGMYDWFSDIQLEKNVSKGKCFHPCQVPVSLMERLIILLANKNTIVVDPFAGVGTTGLAAQRLGYRFIGIELSQEYYKLAKGRLGKVV